MENTHKPVSSIVIEMFGDGRLNVMLPPNDDFLAMFGMLGVAQAAATKRLLDAQAKLVQPATVLPPNGFPRGGN